jgi:hypothetical protein
MQAGRDGGRRAAAANILQMLSVRGSSSTFRGPAEVVADKALFLRPRYRSRPSLARDRPGSVASATTTPSKAAAQPADPAIPAAPNFVRAKVRVREYPDGCLDPHRLAAYDAAGHPRRPISGRPSRFRRQTAVALRISPARSHNPTASQPQMRCYKTGQLEALATICERTPCAGAHSLLRYTSAEGSVLVVGSATAENFKVRASRFVPRRLCSLTLLVMIGRDAWAACSISRDVDSVCRSC